MYKLKMGIIGAGGIAQKRHIPAFQKFQDKVVLYAIHDIDEMKAREVAREFHIEKVFTNYEEMFAEVDAVTIATPNKFHAEISIAALQAGVHVLCEKPMAITTEECKAITEAANISGKVLSTAYHYRFMKEAQAAKKMIQAGEIGEPYVARVQAIRRRKVPGWGVFTSKELQGGGSVIDYGCHLLDLALWLMDDPEPIEIVGSTYNYVSKGVDQVNLWGNFDASVFEVDDHATAYIKFANGASLLFETSWAANIREEATVLSLSGTQGGLDVFPLVLNQAKHGMLLNSEAVWMPGEDTPDLQQAENFIDSCLGLVEPLVKPSEAMKVSKIIEAIYQSSASGKVMSIN
ncbi:Gfo/Idh/MocA family oxidoreductase [Peribacillus simplex]|uniref:Gfo/Idh/MocA family oxidoreductase n=1 Tax=Peribacillus simplex TaxID=1478 RepID=A0AAW7IMX8_9BACI|nr:MULTISPECIES: Gfo/Idh/MocA family oxidoreductase [Peribacillus]AMM91565.1 dehydrogenase [Peribacillus simplex]MDM5214519.1 Gfo/Idh/MocA family oxidoreductase [Peribacillus sp. NJ4]MDM5219812.1 Gfo/Idh/MocA family oxidoreductase [Peribacillus sp. NJ11]MDM5296521.1 Gfo/Idh/MocA family oxidoreductase [Peribacillus simplex]MDM5356917.1 Gfo/Idh/MocA family oxidoreductase [Peribacillus sp. ACCC06369]